MSVMCFRLDSDLQSDLYLLFSPLVLEGGGCRMVWFSSMSNTHLVLSSISANTQHTLNTVSQDHTRLYIRLQNVRDDKKSQQWIRPCAMTPYDAALTPFRSKFKGFLFSSLRQKQGIKCVCVPGLTPAVHGPDSDSDFYLRIRHFNALLCASVTLYTTSPNVKMKNNAKKSLHGVSGSTKTTSEDKKNC